MERIWKIPQNYGTYTEKMWLGGSLRLIRNTEKLTENTTNWPFVTVSDYLMSYFQDVFKYKTSLLKYSFIFQYLLLLLW